MIPTDTPYKILKFLAKFNSDEVLVKSYDRDKYIIHLLDRQFISIGNNGIQKLSKTSSFHQIYVKEILPAYQQYDSFIIRYQISYIENHYTIGDLDALILIEKEKPNHLTLQEILTNYFGSSKHTQTDSNLARAIKAILIIDEFLDENKDQQYLSILYPKENTQYIFLCENKNRLKAPRHNFIEFWYVGGRNIKQLKFIPKPSFPIFYLFDWDFDGLNIYIDIKQNYFPTLASFLPANHETLMKKQEDVKNHYSKWKNDGFLSLLTDDEKRIVSTLIKTDSIIEEQKISLTEENLFYNNL